MITEHKFQYYAFISYSSEDVKWAKWLQTKLENYRIPNFLSKEKQVKYLRPIFRDKSDIGLGRLEQNLSKEIEDSRFLIAICSPKASKSPWVNREIARFKELGRENRIIPFIIEGNPNPKLENQKNCYPDELSKDILGASLNELTKEEAFIKIVAFILHVKYDSLWQRHKKRTALRKKIIFYLFLIATLASILSYKYAVKQEINNFLADCELTELQNSNLDTIKILNINKFKANKLPATLKYFKNIETLNISLKGFESEYFLKDIENLKYLKNIKKLSIESCKTVSIKVLLSLPKLEELSLNFCNEVQDWNQISKLKKIKKLKIFNCNFKDASYLKTLKNISELELSNDEDEEDVENLIYLKDNLKSLTLWNSSIKYFHSLNNLQNLEKLNLTNSIFLKNINFLPKLKKLDLTYSGIENIDGLETIFTLKYLNISSSGNINNYHDIKKLLYKLDNLDTLIIDHKIYEQYEVELRKINPKLKIIDDFY